MLRSWARSVKLALAATLAVQALPLAGGARMTSVEPQRCVTVLAMSKLPRLIVLQPFFTVDTPFDLRLLGIQCWIADTLVAFRLEVASAVHRAEGSDSFVQVTMPNDGELRATLVENEAVYGLLMIFAVEGEGAPPRIQVARLVEAQRGRPLRTLDRRVFDGDTTNLPRIGVEIVERVAARLGHKVRPATWQQLYGTDDLSLADRYLTALGIYSMAEQGLPVLQPEIGLGALVHAVDGGMGAAIGFFPNFVECCRRRRLVDAVAIVAAVSSAVAAIGEVPASWQPMLRALRLSDAPEPN